MIKRFDNVYIEIYFHDGSNLYLNVFPKFPNKIFQLNYCVRVLILKPYQTFEL